MTKMTEMLDRAGEAHRELKGLIEAYLPSLGAEAREHLDALLAPVVLLEKLDGYEVGEMDARSRRFRASGVVRHTECGRAFADALDADDLKNLMDLVAAHECPQAGPEESEVAQAKAAMDQAYKDAVGLNIFDTKTGQLMTRVHEYLHAVVKAERDTVREEYRNSGADETPDLDVLDRVVRLIDPQRG